MNQLQTLFQNYIDTLVQVRSKAGALSGIFGLPGWKDHPCHEAFYQQVEQWVADFLSTDPAPADIEAAANALLRIAADHKDGDSYWYFFAIQRHALRLIPLLDESVCRQLCQQYPALYPNSRHLPLYDEVYRLLCRQANLQKPARRWLDRFRK